MNAPILESKNTFSILSTLKIGSCFALHMQLQCLNPFSNVTIVGFIGLNEMFMKSTQKEYILQYFCMQVQGGIDFSEAVFDEASGEEILPKSFEIYYKVMVGLFSALCFISILYIICSWLIKKFPILQYQKEGMLMMD